MEESFEKNMDELEKIVKELEEGNLNLDESIKKFEQGMQISKKCNQFLEEAEKKITVLIQDSEKMVEEDL